MSIFKKYITEKLITSTLAQGDGSKIILTFSPLKIMDQKALSSLSGLDKATDDEILAGAKTFCEFLGRKIISAVLVDPEGTEVEQPKPTEADFLELLDADFLTIVEIIKDFSPKKV
jgi:hypothetical protein